MQCGSDWSLLRQRILNQGIAFIAKAGDRPSKRKRRLRLKKRRFADSRRATQRRLQLRSRSENRGIFGQKGTSSCWKVFYSEQRSGKIGLPTMEE
jgi:hypothetical protein